MSDPLNDALKEATLAVLLGSTAVQQQTVGPDGFLSIGTVTIESVFAQRLRAKAHEGAFDDLLQRAMDRVNVNNVARAIEKELAVRFLEGLKTTNTWGHGSPNWLQSRAKAIAVEACTIALSADEELIETLRSRIGMEVDRNRVSISVQLADPE